MQRLKSVSLNGFLQALTFSMLAALGFGALQSCGEVKPPASAQKADEDACALVAKGEQPAAPAAQLVGVPGAPFEAPAQSFTLAPGAITYDTEVKPLLQAKCESCHSGTYQPTINTYQLARLNITAILDSVNNNRMPQPPLPPLEPEEILILEGWVENNLKQSESVPNPATAGPAPAPGAPPPPQAGEETAANETPQEVDSNQFDVKCGTLKVLNHTTDAYKSHPLLKRDQVATCHQEGVIYDRNSKVCSEAKVKTSYDCTRQGLIDAFDATPLGIKRVLEKALGKADDPEDFGEFYSIDQCGEFGVGNPIAYLIRLVEVDGDVQLQVKELKVSEE